MTEDFPELDPLIKALTAGPAPAELAGEDAVAAMFSARRAARSRSRFVPSLGMAAAAAIVVVALAGGAYAAVLPPPIQHIAHRVLARIGVPDAQRLGSPPVPSPLSEHSSAVARQPGPVPPATAVAPATTAPTPLPGAAPPGPHLLLGAVRTQIGAGSTAMLDGRLAPPRPGVRVQLLELTGSRWRPAGTALTGRDGAAWFAVRHLTRNTVFRLAEPGTTPSPPVLVTVVPRLTVTLSGSSLPGADVITVSARSAEPGDIVVLQLAAGGAWHDITELRLSSTRRASFTVAVAEGQYYRVVLLATSTHAVAISPALHQPRGNPASAKSRPQP